MPDKKVTAPVDTENFELNVTLDTDESVKIEVHYPTGRGLTAIKALAQVADQQYIVGLLSALRNDASVKEYLEANHLGFDDDEEDY